MAVLIIKQYWNKSNKPLVLLLAKGEEVEKLLVVNVKGENVQEVSVEGSKGGEEELPTLKGEPPI